MDDIRLAVLCARLQWFAEWCGTHRAQSVSKAFSTTGGKMSNQKSLKRSDRSLKLMFDHVVHRDGGYLMQYPKPSLRRAYPETGWFTTARKKWVTCGARTFTKLAAEKFVALLNEHSPWPQPYEAIHIDELPDGIFWETDSDLEEEQRALSAFELPSATGWRADLMFVAGAKPSLDEIEERFRALARKHHPDAGGDREKFEAIAKARDAAKKEIAA